MEQIETMADKRLYEVEALKKVVYGWKMKSDRVVFTNGCFDILHRGHIEYLEEAASLGHRLVVGINSDTSVMKLGKGPNRPFNSQNDRARMLTALRVVDAVIVFDEETPLELIKSLGPDVLVKGGDWAVDQIVGGKEVIASGGEVKSLKLVEGLSTTALEQKIKNG